MMSLKRCARSVPPTQNNMETPSHHGALVVGTGSIGARHARNLRASGIKQITLCDPAARSREALARELSCDECSSLEEGLNDDAIDMVFICSPTKFHIAQAMMAAAHGRHLFIEKPLSHASEGLDELSAIVAQNNVTCMVGCNMRFHFGPATVKRLLDEGRIGTPRQATVYTGSYLPDWHPGTDYRRSYSADPLQGGAILDCIHEIDLALWFLGPATLRSCATQQADTLGIPVEGTADLQLDHEGGSRSAVHLSFMEKEYKRFCAIEGSSGKLFWDFHKKSVEVQDAAGTVRERFIQGDPYDINRMYVDELKHFLQCISSGSDPMGNLHEAISALSIALAARKTKKR